MIKRMGKVQKSRNVIVNVARRFYSPRPANRLQFCPDVKTSRAGVFAKPKV